MCSNRLEIALFVSCQKHGYIDRGRGDVHDLYRDAGVGRCEVSLGRSVTGCKTYGGLSVSSYSHPGSRVFCQKVVCNPRRLFVYSRDLNFERDPSGNKRGLRQLITFLSNIWFVQFPLEHAPGLLVELGYY